MQLMSLLVILVLVWRLTRREKPKAALKALEEPKPKVEKKIAKAPQKTYGELQTKRTTKILLAEIDQLIAAGESMASIAVRAGIPQGYITKYRKGVRPTKSSYDSLKMACQEIAKDRGLFKL